MVKSLKIIALMLLISICFGFTYPKNQIVLQQIENDNFNFAINLISEGEYEIAMQVINQNPNLSHLLLVYRNDLFKTLLENYKPQLIKQVSSHIENNEFTLALNKIDQGIKLYVEDLSLQELKKTCLRKLSEIDSVEYKGEIAHFHVKSLLAFPKDALNSSNSNNETYDQNHLTKTEFELILNQLYQNNYVLIDPLTLFKNENDELIKTTLKLPENKKPIVLSFDDINYKNPENGFIDRLILDRQNKLASYSSEKRVNQRVSYDNEHILILENFIKEFPDFSHQGAKGVICITGFDGVLGYKTQKTNSTSKFEIKKASQIATKLKNLGYRFANFGYYGKGLNTLSDIDFERYLKLWKDEVEPIIGSTPIFCYPENSSDSYQNPKTNKKQQLLVENDYNLFLTAENKTDLKNLTKNSILLNGYNLNGKLLRQNLEQTEKYFNSQSVYDYANRKKPFNS